MTDELTLGADRPLAMEGACEKDRLGRKSFSHEAVLALKNVSHTSGFVLSIEGAWGSGKTSTLAMIEEQLGKSSPQTIVVHFNPWLIGDRSALLSQFLKKISASIRIRDDEALAKELISRLDAYSLAFDLLQLIPGGEVPAQIGKKILGFFRKKKDEELKLLGDPEAKKIDLASTLKRLPNPIIIFIDDIDRLYPQEVFEMVRIIKSVGDLPNVGYVVAWDHKYVATALANLSVPFASAYLDKIIQLRMPLPRLSASARNDLVNQAMALIPVEGTERQFAGDSERFSTLYYAGLRDMLEHPRDVVRVFNSAKVIEPSLRGEIAFTDIVGLSALMVKAPPVFELLCKHPQWFAGLEKEPPRSAVNIGVIKAGAAALERAIEETENPRAARSVIKFLFPLIIEFDDEDEGEPWVRVFADGHIADPARLKVALQRSVSSDEISIVTARRYLFESGKRAEISKGLASENCLDFLESLGDIARSHQGKGIAEVAALCIDIARLPDTSPFLAHRHHSRSSRIGADVVTERAITEIVKSTNVDGAKVAAQIVEDTSALSLATYLLDVSYLNSENASAHALRCAAPNKQYLFNRFAENVNQAVSESRIATTYNPGLIFLVLARGNPQYCTRIFETMQIVGNSALDVFALAMMESKFLQYGRTYEPPTKNAVLTAYCSLQDMSEIAVARLSDSLLGYPTRAAWQAVLENKALYFDGTDAARR